MIILVIAPIGTAAAQPAPPAADSGERAHRPGAREGRVHGSRFAAFDAILQIELELGVGTDCAFREPPHSLETFVIHITSVASVNERILDFTQRSTRELKKAAELCRPESIESF